MGVLEVASLLLGVAAVASVCGYAGSTLARRRKRRTHLVFMIGLFCGAVAHGAVRRARAQLRG